MSQRKNISRRKFLKRATAAGVVAVSFPYVIASSALGKAGSITPSNRITLGFVGLGQHGTKVNLQNFLGNADAQVVALCDVDRESSGYFGGRAVFGREPARRIVEMHYGRASQSGTYKGCYITADWREVIACDDIDAVVVSTPDHWHVPISIAAVKTGKDVYCEKPLTLTVTEGRLLSDTVQRYNRVLQTGSSLRASDTFHRAAELVCNGRIGRLHTIWTDLPEVYPRGKVYPNAERDTLPMPVPEGFDYDMWLGPAPWAPYTKGRCHWNFRWILDYSGGVLTDFGGHYIDQAQWANDTEYTGPIEIDGKGEFPSSRLYNTAKKFRIEYKYANGVRLICRSKYSDLVASIKYEGTEGWIMPGRRELMAYPESILDSVIGPNETHLYTCRQGPERNFLDCVHTRRQPFYPAEVGHRSTTVCHLGNISMLLGRKLKWDPQKERFNDEQANRMLSRSMRSPWHL